MSKENNNSHAVPPSQPEYPHHVTCNALRTKPLFSDGCICEVVNRNIAHPSTHSEPIDERAEFWYPFALKLVRQAYVNNPRPIIGNAPEVEARELSKQMAEFEARTSLERRK